MGRIVTQFRFGLSPLRFDLFSHNISDNLFCPSCGNFLKTIHHFLFECVSYYNYRAALLSDLNHIVLSSLSDTVGSVVTDPVTDDVLTHFIIHGTG